MVPVKMINTVKKTVSIRFAGSLRFGRRQSRFDRQLLARANAHLAYDNPAVGIIVERFV